MKAIVNVHKKSSQAKNNFHTFDVVEIFSNFIALNINGVTTDFSHKEVIIIDFEKELQSAWDKAKSDDKEMKKLHHLRDYKMANKIQ